MVSLSVVLRRRHSVPWSIFFSGRKLGNGADNAQGQICCSGGFSQASAVEQQELNKMQKELMQSPVLGTEPPTVIRGESGWLDGEKLCLGPWRTKNMSEHGSAMNPGSKVVNSSLDCGNRSPEYEVSVMGP